MTLTNFACIAICIRMCVDVAIEQYICIVKRQERKEKKIESCKVVLLIHLESISRMTLVNFVCIAICIRMCVDVAIEQYRCIAKRQERKEKKNESSKVILLIRFECISKMTWKFCRSVDDKLVVCEYDIRLFVQTRLTEEWSSLSRMML